jgi:uracil DNA glycosylase
LALREFLKKEYFEHTVYPDMNDIFNAFKFTDYNDVKALILGQDPYINEGQAHGLSFSVKEGIDPPPSLINIFKEMDDDLGISENDFKKSGLNVSDGNGLSLLHNSDEKNSKVSDIADGSDSKISHNSDEKNSKVSDIARGNDSRISHNSDEKNPEKNIPYAVDKVLTEDFSHAAESIARLNGGTKNGCLEYLARQGVMLLNAVLTVRKGAPNSHKGKGWEHITDRVISVLNEREKPVVFILWGRNARDKKSLITNPRHLILESAHPSPLSAYNGFFGSKPFSKTNAFLRKNGIEEIKWRR